MLPSVRKLNVQILFNNKISHMFHIRYGERTKLKLHKIIRGYEIFSTRNITKLRYMLYISLEVQGTQIKDNLASLVQRGSSNSRLEPTRAAINISDG